MSKRKIKVGSKVKVTNFDLAVVMTDGELERADPKFFYAPATVLGVNGRFPSCQPSNGMVTNMLNNVMLIDANDNILFINEKFLEFEKTELNMSYELVGTLWKEEGSILMFCQINPERFCFIELSRGNRYSAISKTFDEACEGLTLQRVLNYEIEV